MMSDPVRDQLLEARDLIQAKRYPQARALLVTIDHPKAYEWLQKLDEVEARERSASTQVVHNRQMNAETMESRNPYAQQPAYAAQQPYAQQPYAQQPVYDPIRDAAISSYSEASRSEKRTNLLHVIGALIGGLVGATLGGAIWAAVAYFTEYEIGYIAIAVGFLAGAFAVLFSGGRRGIPIQLVAVLTALLGIVAGKYAAFYMIGIKTINEQAGQDFTTEIFKLVPPFDPEIIRGIAEGIVQSLQPIDALFVILAAFAAIRIAASAGKSRREAKLRAA